MYRNTVSSLFSLKWFMIILPFLYPYPDNSTMSPFLFWLSTIYMNVFFLLSVADIFDLSNIRVFVSLTRGVPCVWHTYRRTDRKFWTYYRILYNIWLRLLKAQLCSKTLLGYQEIDCGSRNGRLAAPLGNGGARDTCLELGGGAGGDLETN